MSRLKTIVLLGLAAQLASIAAPAQAEGLCMRFAMNAAKQLAVAVSPAVKVSSLGAGFAASYYLIGSAIKSTGDFKVNGQVDGKLYSFEAVVKQPACKSARIAAAH